MGAMLGHVAPVVAQNGQMGCGLKSATSLLDATKSYTLCLKYVFVFVSVWEKILHFVTI